jgi:hypothetical protein
MILFMARKPNTGKLHGVWTFVPGQCSPTPAVVYLAFPTALVPHQDAWCHLRYRKVSPLVREKPVAEGRGLFWQQSSGGIQPSLQV